MITVNYTKRELEIAEKYEKELVLDFHLKIYLNKHDYPHHKKELKEQFMAEWATKGEI